MSVFGEQAATAGNSLDQTPPARRRRAAAAPQPALQTSFDPSPKLDQPQSVEVENDPAPAQAEPAAPPPVKRGRKPGQRKSKAEQVSVSARGLIPAKIASQISHLQGMMIEAIIEGRYKDVVGLIEQQ